MAISDIYQLKLTQSYKGQVECLNVFHFQQTAGTGAAAQLENAFALTLLPLIQAIASADISYVGMVTENLFNLADFKNTAFSPGVVGLRSSLSLPPFCAWSFQYDRPTRAIRYGWKRFTGVAEDEQEDGLASGLQITRLGDLATALGNPITSALSPGATFAPVVVKRIKYFPGGGTVPAYRLPTTLAEAQFYTVTDVFSIQEVSTQNSRKFGRGI